MVGHMEYQNFSNAFTIQDAADTHVFGCLFVGIINGPTIKTCGIEFIGSRMKILVEASTFIDCLGRSSSRAAIQTECMNVSVVASCFCRCSPDPSASRSIYLKNYATIQECALSYSGTIVLYTGKVNHNNITECSSHAIMLDSLDPHSSIDSNFCQFIKGKSEYGSLMIFYCNEISYVSRSCIINNTYDNCFYAINPSIELTSCAIIENNIKWIFLFVESRNNTITCTDCLIPLDQRTTNVYDRLLLINCVT